MNRGVDWNAPDWGGTVHEASNGSWVDDTHPEGGHG